MIFEKLYATTYKREISYVNKRTYQKPSANIMLRDDFRYNPIKSRRHACFQATIQHSTGRSSQSNTTRKIKKKSINEDVFTPSKNVWFEVATQ